MPHFHENIEKKSHLFSLYGVICLLRHFGGQLIDEFFEILVKLVLKLELQPVEERNKELIIREEVLGDCLVNIIIVIIFNTFF